MTDDAKLAKAAGKGDGDALEALIRRHAPTVFVLLSGLLAGATEAADATEETFVRLARGVGRYDSGEPVDTWILNIARRVCADHRDATPAMGGAWAALGRLDHQQREVLTLRELLRWDDAAIARTLGIDEDGVADRLADARSAAATAVHT